MLTIEMLIGGLGGFALVLAFAYWRFVIRMKPAQTLVETPTPKTKPEQSTSSEVTPAAPKVEASSQRRRIDRDTAATIQGLEETFARINQSLTALSETLDERKLSEQELSGRLSELIGSPSKDREAARRPSREVA